MLIDLKQVARLTQAVAEEGNPRMFFAPLPVLPTGLVLPRAWQDLLVQDNPHKQVLNLLWTSGAQVLPRVVATLRETLQAVTLLITDLNRPSLIYIFTKKGRVFARRGYPSVESLPPVNKQLSVDLSPIYSVHDGWVDIFSADTGPLPVDQWEILGSSQPNVQDGFLRVFRTGGNAMGFDLTEHPAGSYIIWSDGEVEEVEDFWEELDSWISGQLEEMDRSKG